MEEAQGLHTPRGARPEKGRYLRGSGLAVHTVHRLGAGVDGVGKFLLHVSMGLSYLSDARENEKHRTSEQMKGGLKWKL